jgi:hypothetical protein
MLRDRYPTEMTLVQKAQFHAEGIYGLPMRCLETVSLHHYIFGVLYDANKHNPKKIHVQMVHDPDQFHKIDYVIVKRKVGDDWQKAIINVQPVNFSNDHVTLPPVDYYKAYDFHNEHFGD